MSCKLRTEITSFLIVVTVFFNTYRICHSISLGQREDDDFRTNQLQESTSIKTDGIKLPNDTQHKLRDTVERVTRGPNVLESSQPNLREPWLDSTASFDPDINFVLTVGNISRQARSPGPRSGDGYQSQFTDFDVIHGNVFGPSIALSPHFSEWLGMRPLVQCDDSVMTLTVTGQEFTHLLVDRVGASPLSLFQLPPVCGYSVKRSWVDLEMNMPYDACYIMQKNGRYVQPMLWWGSPLYLSCPVQMSTVPPPPVHSVPSVFCSAYGMAVQIHGQEHVVPMLGTNVNGKLSPFVSEECAFLIHSHHGDIAFFVSFIARCINRGDNLYLHLIVDDRRYTLSCPINYPFPYVPSPPPGKPQSPYIPDPVSPAPTSPTTPPPQTPTQGQISQFPDHHHYIDPQKPYFPPLSPAKETTQTIAQEPGSPRPTCPPDTYTICSRYPLPHHHAIYPPHKPPAYPPVPQHPHPAPAYPPVPQHTHPAPSYPPVPQHTHPAPSYPPVPQHPYPAPSYPPVPQHPYPAPAYPPVPQHPYHPRSYPPVPQHPHPAPAYPPVPQHPHPAPSYPPVPQHTHPAPSYPPVPQHTHPQPPIITQKPSTPDTATGAPSTPSLTLPPQTEHTPQVPYLQCLTERMVVFLAFAHPDSIEVRDNRKTWLSLSSIDPRCEYKLQMAEGFGVILHSPLPACHSWHQTPTTISLPVKFWDLSTGKFNTMVLQCPFQTTHETPPDTTVFPSQPVFPSPPSSTKDTAPSVVTKPKVFCFSDQMTVELPSGPISEIVVQDIKGNHMNIKDAPKHCGYSVRKSKDGKIRLSLQLHSRCHGRVEGKMYIIVVHYTTIDGRHESQFSCPVVTPVSGQECNLPSEQRLPCGSGSVTHAQCLSLGCCSSKHPRACYYPMDECTVDRHFVFTVPATVTEPPLSPALLVAAGNSTCKPERVTSDYALFKIPMDGCGTRRLMVGKTVVYMLEVVNKVHAISLNYGTITRDSPVRVLVECRFMPGTVLSVGYMVKTPNLGPQVQTQGVFGVQLRIAKDSHYSSYYPQYHQPLHMLLGKPLHLEVRLLNNPDPSLVLLVHFCVAYPRSGAAVWLLLYNGCPNPYDPASKQAVLSDPEPPYPQAQTRRFNISTFQFLPDGDLQDQGEEIYFMCSTEICSPHDGPCVEGCFGQ